MTLAVFLVVLLLGVIVYALVNLTDAVNRVAKSTRRIARILDRPRRERADVEDEIERIYRAIKTGNPVGSDRMTRLEELEAKLERMKQRDV